MKQQKTFSCWSGCIVFGFALIVGVSSFAENKKEAAKALIEKKCTVCHSIDRVYEADKNHAEWEQTVKKMTGYSDQMNFLNQKEKETIIEFLAQRKAPQVDTE
uniref:hypothetical protein n=1 Tax=Candidatus Electrothrix sp. TaxID=2170559 RepID=UPI004056E47B